MADKYVSAIRAAASSTAKLTPNQQHDFDKVCSEQSQRGKEARRIRDGKK